MLWVRCLPHATITVNSVDVAAQAANMGIDFLWVEMEHSPTTLETYRDIVRKVGQGYPTVAMEPRLSFVSISEGE